MNNQIPQGYKDSPLGIIPKEWKVKRLGDIAEIGSGGTPSKRHDEYWNGCIPWVTTSLINKPYIDVAEEYITEEGLKNSSAKLLDAGVLLMAMYGQGQTRGKVSKLLIKASTNQACAYISVHTGVVDYIHQYLIANYENIRKESNDGNQKNLSLTIISNIRILCPPIKEQEKINRILQFWDTAIEKQSELIEKLTLRKRALMQQLLTGKKQLPGFSGEWKRIKLDNIAERVTRKNEDDNRNVVTISAQRGFVVQTDFFNKSVASETLDNYFLVHKDEFCYNKSYSNGYPMGTIKRLKAFDKAVVTTLYICFRLKDKTSTNIDFFEQYCESGIFNKGLVKVANEGGRAHGLLNVTPSDFFNMHMSIPDIDEQDAIASVLVNADKEIELANEKLANLQSQKRGLMQQLLTGKKRIV